MRPVWTLALALALGCAGKRAGKKAGGAFSLGNPGEGWVRVVAGGADYAWFHEPSSSTIYADANCAARYQDGRLPDLLTHLTFGVARGAPLMEEPRTLDGRDALIRKSKGSLDGVAVSVGAMVTKKHDCLYDVVYIAPPSLFDDGWSTFETVLAGFKVGG